MASHLSFSDVTLINVKPLRKATHVETISPTLADLFTTDCYMPILFAYRLEKNPDAYVQFVKRLKASLEKILARYFPFAGRWIPDVTHLRQLLCNDEGVPFIEAQSDKDLDSVIVAGSGFQPVPELNGFEVLGMDCLRFCQHMTPGGLPPVFVQVTGFKCGGVVLGVAFNHMHCDGRAFFDFMTAWSELARTGETPATPSFDRSQAITAEALLGPMGFAGAVTLTYERLQTAWGASQSRQVKTYEVKLSVIETLKKEARESSSKGSEPKSYISTQDCITAHLWQSMARLPVSLTEGKEFEVGQVIEGREKFYDPPLSNVCGNVYTSLISPKLSTPDLVNNPLHWVALQLREKLLTTTKESWWSAERYGEMMQSFTNDQILLVNITSWSRFPLYDVDFGVGKRPFFANVNLNFPDAYLAAAFISPPVPAHSSSAATVTLVCRPEALTALQSQSEFLAFFLGG